MKRLRRVAIGLFLLLVALGVALAVWRVKDCLDGGAVMASLTKNGLCAGVD